MLVRRKFPVAPFAATKTYALLVAMVSEKSTMEMPLLSANVKQTYQKSSKIYLNIYR